MFGLRYDAQVRSPFYALLAKSKELQQCFSSDGKGGNGNSSERSKRHYLTSKEIQERKYDPQWAILRDFFKENDCKYPFNLALHKELRVVKGLWLTVSRKKCSFRRLR